MRVRAVVDTWLGVGVGYKRAGVEFDYDGPPNPHLEPIGAAIEIAVPVGAPTADGPAPPPRPSKKKAHRIPKNST